MLSVVISVCLPVSVSAGVSLSAGHEPYPAPSAADAPAADFPATSRTASRSRCDSRSTLSGSAVSRSDMADRSRSCPAISLTASSVLPSGRSGLFSAIFLTISSARRSVSRRMASSACRCASTSAVTGSPFPAPAGRCYPGYPHAATGDGTGIPRTTFTGNSHHHTAVRIITGNPDAILHIISQQALSVTAALQATNCASPLPFTRPSPLNPAARFRHPWSVGSARYQLTCRYGQTPAVPHTAADIYVPVQ